MDDDAIYIIFFVFSVMHQHYCFCFTAKGSYSYDSGNNPVLLGLAALWRTLMFFFPLETRIPVLDFPFLFPKERMFLLPYMDFQMKSLCKLTLLQNRLRVADTCALQGGRDLGRSTFSPLCLSTYKLPYNPLTHPFV